MVNPYRKLFNLFAFSLLAFAVYLNFFRTDSNPLPESKIQANQTNVSAQQKTLPATDGTKMSLATVAKKN